MNYQNQTSNQDMNTNLVMMSLVLASAVLFAMYKCCFGKKAETAVASIPAVAQQPEPKIKAEVTSREEFLKRIGAVDAVNNTPANLVLNESGQNVGESSFLNQNGRQ